MPGLPGGYIEDYIASKAIIRVIYLDRGLEDEEEVD